MYERELRYRNSYLLPTAVLVCVLIASGHCLGLVSPRSMDASGTQRAYAGAVVPDRNVYGTTDPKTAQLESYDPNSSANTTAI